MQNPHDFSRRHLGPCPAEQEEMLRNLGCESMARLVEEAVPEGIRLEKGLELPEALSEAEALKRLRSIAGKNKLCRSFIGAGYYGTITPPVIRRNVFENPGWYTAYTPYQAEIAQGRLEALLNFQTMVTDLTGLDVANASLLDEGTAVAEATSMAVATKRGRNSVFVSDRVHPQTLDVVMTRAEPLGIDVKTGPWREFDPVSCAGLAAVVVQYPDTGGAIDDFEAFFGKVHEAGALAITAADPLALTLLKPPGEFGADLCVGSCQRFGVPMGFGGPHAAFIACSDALKRRLPGRLVGVSLDARGKPGYRLALQTREQHIRRDKATSNICTAQVLLAVMAAMYAVYHGPDGLRAIASGVHRMTTALAGALMAAGVRIENGEYFDTIVARVPGRAAEVMAAALERGYNLRSIDADRIGISLDESATAEDIVAVAEAFGAEAPDRAAAEDRLPGELLRSSEFLTHPVFSRHQSETAMLRYLRGLEGKDLALNESMIPLGSCTMKLNAAAEMMPLGWPEISELHPFVPEE